MKKYSEAELCLIWLDSFTGLEYKHKQQAYSLIKGKSGIKSVIENCKDYIAAEAGESVYLTLKNSANAAYLNYVTESLDNRGVIAVTAESEDYPEKLLQTELPPLVLYAKGNVALLQDEIFGIVGSRKSLPADLNAATVFAESLSDAGFTLATGIAEGVDSAVINAAIDKRGNVISVVAGGFDNAYPASNRELLKAVAKSGLVVSEHPPEVVAKPYFFPVRNRIIAGLSEGVLIVSGGTKSGALYTAEYAEEYGRELFAVPHGYGVKSGEGCNDLIKRGARLADKPSDVLSVFGKEEKPLFKASLSEDERAVVNALASGGLHTEEICAKTGRPVYEIASVLSGLEIKGIIVKSGFNAYGLKR